MKRRLSTLLAASAVALGVNGALAQTAPVLSSPVRHGADSGFVRHAGGGGAAVVWSHLVQVNHAPWLRLQFDEVLLAGQLGAGNGAYLMLTSLHDGGQQRLDAKSIGEWYKTSAYFNGDRVLVELYAYPNTGDSRVTMSSVTAGQEGVGPFPETICGPTDDRVLSNLPANARLMPIGCTAWLIDLGNCANRFLTAGHCIAVGTTNAVVQFNVPLSTSGGTPVNPPPQDQYPAISASIQSNGGQGIGLDAAQFFTSPNSVTNQAPRFVQNAAYTLASVAPQPSNQVTRITGYGVTSSPVSATWSQVQKTHTGAFVGRNPPTSLQYTADTTGGNSGSPVVLESNGQAFGIHTHGGCTSTGGANSGTAIDYPTLVGYLQNPLAGCISFIPPTLTVNHTPSTLVPPSVALVLDAEVVPGTQQIASASIFYRYDTGAFTSLALVNTSGNNWRATLPAPGCGDAPQYYFSVQGTGGATVTLPANAPTEVFSSVVGVLNQQVNAVTSFEGGLPAGWSATGLWTMTGSTCGNGTPCDGTGIAYYGSTATCTYATGGTANSGDLTSGAVVLPSIGAGESLTLDYCSSLVTENNASYDHAYVFINGTQVDQAGESSGWENRSADISAFAGQSVTIRFRFETIDGVLNDFRGWQVDNVRVRKAGVTCDSCYPDCNQSGSLTIADFSCFQTAFVAAQPYADCNQSGSFTIADFSCFQAEFAAGCP